MTTEQPCAPPAPSTVLSLRKRRIETLDEAADEVCAGEGKLVETLDATCNYLSAFVPRVALTSLRRLFLGANRLTAVPPGLCVVAPVLEELRLNNNAIGAVTGLTGLTRLTTLDFRQNQICSVAGAVPPEVAATLRWLSFSCNAVEDPETLPLMPRLEYLGLFACNIATWDCDALAAKLPNVTALNMDATPAFAALAGRAPLPNLRELNHVTVHNVAVRPRTELGR